MFNHQTGTVKHPQDVASEFSCVLTVGISLKTFFLPNSFVSAFPMPELDYRLARVAIIFFLFWTMSLSSYQTTVSWSNLLLRTWSLTSPALLKGSKSWLEFWSPIFCCMSDQIFWLNGRPSVSNLLSISMCSNAKSSVRNLHALKTHQMCLIQTLMHQCIQVVELKTSSGEIEDLQSYDLVWRHARTDNLQTSKQIFSFYRLSFFAVVIIFQKFLLTSVAHLNAPAASMVTNPFSGLISTRNASLWSKNGSRWN